MKIYTKTGDKGTTSLIGGKRVPKNHPRIEAYGTLDELISQLGVVRACDIDDGFKSVVFEIQQKLMDCSALLASESANVAKLPSITESDVEFLENKIDLLGANLPMLKKFVVPGDGLEESFCHVARCVCRRAERAIISLAEEAEIDRNIPIYVNRLSDYLFVLARSVAGNKKSRQK